MKEPLGMTAEGSAGRCRCDTSRAPSGRLRTGRAARHLPPRRGVWFCRAGPATTHALGDFPAATHASRAGYLTCSLTRARSWSFHIDRPGHGHDQLGVGECLAQRVAEASPVTGGHPRLLARFAGWWLRQQPRAQQPLDSCPGTPVRRNAQRRLATASAGPKSASGSSAAVPATSAGGKATDGQADAAVAASAAERDFPARRAADHQQHPAFGLCCLQSVPQLWSASRGT